MENTVYVFQDNNVGLPYSIPLSAIIGMEPHNVEVGFWRLVYRLSPASPLEWAIVDVDQLMCGLGWFRGYEHVNNQMRAAGEPPRYMRSFPPRD